MESLFKLGILIRLVDMVSGPVMTMSRNLEGLENKVKKLDPVFEKFRDYGKWLAGAGAGAALGLGVAVTQFANLEEAQLGLKTTIMDATGVVGSEYQRLNALAERLGTDLPGTTRDMLQMFITLKEQGVQSRQILNGLGESAANLAAVLKLPYPVAAEHVAKFSHSLGVQDDEMIRFMDTIQRVHYASGVTASDLSYTFKHLGGSLKLMGLQGLNAANDVAVVIGMLARSGIEGETAGTAIAMAFNRMAEMTHRMDRAQIKKLLDPILAPRGIKLEFFNADGSFKGIRAMVAELEKLKPLSERDRILVLEKLFRAGSGSTSTLGNLAMGGVAAYDQMLARMQNMASLQQKITLIMSGAKMQWETMTGTISNLVAHIGGVVVHVAGLVGLMKLVNNLAGKLDAWVLANPKTAGTIAGIVIGITGLLLVMGGFLLVIGIGGTLITKMVMGLAFLIQALAWAKLAVVGFSAALWANPITWVVAAVIALTVALAWAYNRFEKVRTAIQFTNFFLGWLIGNLLKLATLDFWSGMFESGRRLMMTLVAGIKSVATHPVDAVKGVFARIRNLLPFSDAKEGPLSQLTLSGRRIMETMGQGITLAGPQLKRAMAGALAGAAITTNVAVTKPANGENGGRQVVIQQLTIQMNNVADADDFIRQLQDLVGSIDG